MIILSESRPVRKSPQVTLHGFVIGQSEPAGIEDFLTASQKGLVQFLGCEPWDLCREFCFFVREARVQEGTTRLEIC